MTKKQTEVWTVVETAREVSRCRCDLTPGMTHEQLTALAPHSCKMPSYLCPAVDRYLRGTPTTIPEEDFTA